MSLAPLNAATIAGTVSPCPTIKILPPGCSCNTRRAKRAWILRRHVHGRQSEPQGQWGGSQAASLIGRRINRIDMPCLPRIAEQAREQCRARRPDLAEGRILTRIHDLLRVAHHDYHGRVGFDPQPHRTCKNHRRRERRHPQQPDRRQERTVAAASYVRWSCAHDTNEFLRAAEAANRRAGGRIFHAGWARRNPWHGCAA